jgi:hypothetical protein
MFVVHTGYLPYLISVLCFYILVFQIRILLVTLMRIRIRILASKYRLKTMKKYSNSSYSKHFSLLLQTDEDPDPDLAYHFEADPYGSGTESTTLLRRQKKSH